MLPDAYIYLVYTNVPGGGNGLHSAHKHFNQAEEVANKSCYLEVRRIMFGDKFDNSELWLPRSQEWK